jgi:glycosyltransferase involved in cell wall biosynthesis
MVATAVGGVGEIVSDGVNGLLVPPGSPEAFGHALQRLLESPELQTSLSDGALESVLELDAGRIYRQIEQLLQAAVRS